MCANSIISPISPLSHLAPFSNFEKFYLNYHPYHIKSFFVVEKSCRRSFLRHNENFEVKFPEISWYKVGTTRISGTIYQASIPPSTDESKMKKKMYRDRYNGPQ